MLYTIFTYFTYTDVNLRLCAILQHVCVLPHDGHARAETCCKIKYPEQMRKH